jgi:hypothetical protein
MSNQAYYNGNFWQALVTTNPGDTPDSAPASWNLIPIPARFRFALSQLTYSHMLALDGQGDKAAAARNTAMVTERVGLDDLARKEANSERWLERPSVNPGQQSW